MPISASTSISTRVIFYQVQPAFLPMFNININIIKNRNKKNYQKHCQGQYWLQNQSRTILTTRKCQYQVQPAFLPLFNININIIKNRNKKNYQKHCQGQYWIQMSIPTSTSISTRAICTLSGPADFLTIVEHEHRRYQKQKQEKVIRNIVKNNIDNNEMSTAAISININISQSKCHFIRCSRPSYQCSTSTSTITQTPTKRAF